MELMKFVTCCCLASILLTDVVLASPARSRDIISEAERLEYAIEEGLAVYRTEKKRRRRHRRRTNLLIEAMRMCRNFRHYPRDRIPARCRDMIFRQDDRRRDHSGPTIVIIEK